jgi:error-prone DNA polymerase
MIANGYAPAFAERTFAQLEGFGSYGFPLSHAASFALIAYASAWAKCHHPDVFLAAILNSLPMGFYAAAQLVQDAQRHGVEVRPVDVNHSRWDCTLEGEGPALRAVRLGLRRVAGLANQEAAKLVAARDVPYRSVADLQRRAGLGQEALKRLAAADAFGSLRLDRRQASWASLGLRDTPLPLFAAADGQDGMPEPTFQLKPAPASRQVVDDYAATGLSLKAHPVVYLRAALARRGVTPSADLAKVRDGQGVRVAGLVLVRQRPGSAKGVMFLTLEDETGACNVIVWPNLLERFRRTALAASMMGVEGKLQREGLVVHVIAARLVDLTPALRRLGRQDDTERLGPQVKEDLHPDLRIDRCIQVQARNFR